MPGYLSDLSKTINSIRTDSKFVLQQEIMGLIEHTFRMHCDWCSTADDKPLVSIVKEKLTAYLPQINATILDTQKQVRELSFFFWEGRRLFVIASCHFFLVPPPLACPK